MSGSLLASSSQTVRLCAVWHDATAEMLAQVAAYNRKSTPPPRPMPPHDSPLMVAILDWTKKSEHLGQACAARHPWWPADFGYKERWLM